MELRLITTITHCHRFYLYFQVGIIYSFIKLVKVEKFVFLNSFHAKRYDLPTFSAGKIPTKLYLHLEI